MIGHFIFQYYKTIQLVFMHTHTHAYVYHISSCSALPWCWFDRLNDDEIRRFYASTKGDFQRTLSLVKKTIQWRQSYTFLSPQELQAWSHLVFWHGYDLKKRPCLIIRLGLACSNLRASERDFFAKVIGNFFLPIICTLGCLENDELHCIF